MLSWKRTQTWLASPTELGWVKTCRQAAVVACLWQGASMRPRANAPRCFLAPPPLQAAPHGRCGDCGRAAGRLRVAAKRSGAAAAPGGQRSQVGFRAPQFKPDCSNVARPAGVHCALGCRSSCRLTSTHHSCCTCCPHSGPHPALLRLLPSCPPQVGARRPRHLLPAAPPLLPPSHRGLTGQAGAAAAAGNDRTVSSAKLAKLAQPPPLATTAQ